MTAQLKIWLKTNETLLGNALTLIGTSGVSAFLGFAFWWVAARFFAKNEVGLASASIASMIFWASMAKFGVGAWLIGELSRHPQNTKPLLMTSMLVNGAIGFGFGGLYAFIAPLTSNDFAPLIQPLNRFLFALGTAVCTIGFVMDEAVIGLLRGDVQLVRNLFFAATKLIVLGGLTWLNVGLNNGMVIFMAWALCETVSLFWLMRLPALRSPRTPFKLDRTMLRALGKGAITHHLTNLAFDSPKTLLPVLVTYLLTANATASFYIAWMMVGLAVLLPMTLTSVLYAVGSAQPHLLRQKMRTTLLGSTLASVCAVIGFMLFSDVVMGLFGSDYAQQAAPVLRILSLAAFPLIIKFHYLAIHRIFNRLSKSMRLLLLGVALELSFAIIGGHIGGLWGLSVGWVCANFVQATFMLRSVARAYRGNISPAELGFAR
jgi:O-antigen/teichoic acid export membrane protein